MEIRDIMSKDFDWIAPDLSLAKAAKLMLEKDTGFLPVGEDDKLIGTLTDRDIVLRAVAKGLDPNTEKARDHMTPKLLYCFDDQSVDEICANLSEIKVRRLPVVNREKRLVGIVSLGDLSQALAPTTGEALKAITDPATSVSAAA